MAYILYLLTLHEALRIPDREVSHNVYIRR